MIGAICSLLAIAIAVPTSGQTTQSFISPCPHVFMYDPAWTEAGKWYGVVNISTDITLYALWLNIVLESKADILGNWVGEVTTDDNMDFKIENTEMEIKPGPPLSIRFFIQYNAQNKVPKLKAIRFNGREICNVDTHEVRNETGVRHTVGRVPTRTDLTNSTIKPTVTTSRTTKPQYLTQNHKSPLENKTQTVTAAKPQVWSQIIGENKSEDKITRPDEKSQTSSVDKVLQIWSQVTGNNSPTKTEIRTQAENKPSPTKAENNSQVKNKNKSPATVIEPLVWPRYDEAENQAANSKDRQQIGIENTSQSQTQFWPKIPNDDHKQIQTHSQQPNRSENKFIIDDTPLPYMHPIYVRPENKQPMPVEILTANDNLHTRTQEGERQPWSKEKTSSRDRIEFESAGEQPTGYSNVDRSGLPLNGYQLTTTPPPVNIRPEDEQKTDYETDYVIGGLPTIYIPNHPRRRTQPQCGRVLLDKYVVPYGRGTGSRLEGQWPWQIALYQQRTAVDSKYICGGTLVSRNHIITAAHCVTRTGQSRVVNKNTLTVYLGKYNLRTSVDGVQVKFVNQIIINPEYNATTYSHDLAILELREPVTYSDWVQPACLWPENEKALSNIVGRKGSVVGWGFDPSGIPREDLSLVEMPVVDQKTCVRSYDEFYRKFTSDYTYCAGYGDDTSMCSSDSGGGMVFKKGNNWYLRGLASLSVARRGKYLCDPSHFVIFTDIAQFLPWIEDNIDDY